MKHRATIVATTIECQRKCFKSQFYWNSKFIGIKYLHAKNQYYIKAILNPDYSLIYLIYYLFYLQFKFTQSKLTTEFN